MLTITYISIIILFAIWNGYKITGKSNAWHSVGFIIRLLLVGLVYIDRGIWVALLAGFIAWIPYNGIINIFLKQKFFYIGITSVIDKFIRKILGL